MKTNVIVMFAAALLASCGGPQRTTTTTATTTSERRTTTAVATATAAPARTPSASPGGPTADARAIVEQHNARRAKHCAPPLAWSNEVATVAQAWADRCVFQHSQGKYGENLAMGTSRIMSPEHVVEMWYDGEVASYDFARPGFGMRTGHFTQVVWKGTTHVGCGSAECGGQRLWVCNYDPPGNFIGEFPKNVAPLGCKD
jgi:uncharacterized protein YkwD